MELTCFLPKHVVLCNFNARSLKRKCHFDVILITEYIESCHNADAASDECFVKDMIFPFQFWYGNKFGVTIFSICIVFIFVPAMLYNPHVLFYIDIYAWLVDFMVLLPFREGSGEALCNVAAGKAVMLTRRVMDLVWPWWTWRSLAWCIPQRGMSRGPF